MGICDECADKDGAGAQRDPNVFTAHASRDVIEGEGRKRHKRRHKDGHHNVSVARGLTGAAGTFALRNFRKRGDYDAKTKRRDQASIHSKAQSGRDTARQHDRFVE